MGVAYIGKNHKVTVSHMSHLSRIIIGAGKKSGCLSNKDWLGSEVVAQVQGETLRPRQMLADIVLRTTVFLYP